MSLFVAQQNLTAYRDATNENAARQANHSATYTTKGNGHFIDKKKMMFDCVFTSEPAITHAQALIKAPNKKHYKYPICNVGVWKWVLHQSQADAGKKKDDPTANPYYVGAYLYFVVQVDPLIYPRTDGSNLADLQKQLTKAQAKASPDATYIHALKANIAEAKEAIWLNTHPPKVVIDHHITFTQVAMKKLPETMTQQLNGDPTLQPHQVSFG